MNTARRVLISGASIAGPAVAHWLTRYGHRCVVVERAPTLRTAGQNIDIRGAGREVIRRMELEESVGAAGTGEKGTRFVGRDGGTVAEFPVGGSDSDGLTAGMEILRGDLARLLVERSTGSGRGGGAEYRFGDSVTALRQDADHVRASFAGGSTEDFDLVIAADGMRSTTRPLIVGDAARIVPKGLCTAYFTIPRRPEDTDWWRWYSAPGGRTVTLRPDNTGTIRAGLSFLGPDGKYADLPADAQRELLAEVFAGAGWATPRVLDGMRRAPDFHLEDVGQVHSATWSRGRAALLGDAAYCASPISGMGTSLALVGAYVLAGEIASHRHHRDAFAAYERIMRPYVTKAQSLPPGAPRLAHPRTRCGITAFHSVLRLAATAPARRLATALTAPPADGVQLPDYTHLEA
ncbi:2-polyprenyl-6-methoxyphenol hydroxylase-like FAD-dependent oxidoreductase [Kitasatospora sp. SolWspMP-SS2h]|uniref:FAD-dependent monooxygenase n=1 Tax=Kitasatospora sp. SolWspMP-SS2h TaxID=1305729 RepID=UPI000DBA6491|nr:FAD-dependent monooxygenase [Kitasatospora sp. SolWspMP-SS2h]RAJ31286.1 2-polyprenyl-6-methoxyphenol hydroxylase-like FAD-dependent oxidoreductase [Kitasatospora sp. SolWspMP-SS2h]